MAKPEDKATLLPADTWGGTWSSSDGWGMFTPPDWPQDEDLPLQATALFGAILRLQQDAGFVAQMAQWFEDQQT